MKPTIEDVEKLKNQWLSDPIWDIECTEGFEDYKDELKAFSDSHYHKWEKQRQQRLEEQYKEKADELGLSYPKDWKIIKYIFHLEFRLNEIEDKVI